MLNFIRPQTQKCFCQSAVISGVYNLRCGVSLLSEALAKEFLSCRIGVAKYWVIVQYWWLSST